MKGRDYLWILARAPHLDDDSLAAARAVARENGFEVDRLMPTSQRVPPDHDADGRKDRVPNRLHAAGEIPHQPVTGRSGDDTHFGSVHARS